MFDEDMSDITDWTDKDIGNGDSSQVTFDSKSCMSLYSTVTGVAWREKSAGSFGTRTVFSFNLYSQSIWQDALSDTLRFGARKGTQYFRVLFSSPTGLFVYHDGTTKTEIGTNIVSLGTWQEWTFDVDWASETVDVYLDFVYQGSSTFAASSAFTIDDGGVIFVIQSANFNVRAYIDWVKVGNNFDSQAYSFIL
jgi:hypothetical protein